MHAQVGAVGAAAGAEGSLRHAESAAASDDVVVGRGRRLTLAWRGVRHSLADPEPRSASASDEPTDAFGAASVSAAAAVSCARATGSKG